jgi:hypothetical protein
MNCALREEKSGDAQTASTGWGTKEKDGLGWQARTAGREVPLLEPLCHVDASIGKTKVWRLMSLDQNLTEATMLAVSLNTAAGYEFRKNMVGD